MKLTNKNYYSQKANKEFFSVSQIKDFLKCEAQAMAKLSGEWVEEPTTAMLIGSYVDSWFEGTLEDFKEQTPQIFKKDGSLKSDYIKAEKIIERVQKDELFTKCMSGKKQIIMTGEIYGEKFKIKMDSYIPHEAIVDLKCIQKIRDITFKNGYKQTFIEQWGYDLQLAVYQDIVRQNTGEILPCIIAAVDKQEYADIECILIPQEQLDFQLKNLEWKLDRIAKVKRGEEEPHRCGLCNYCKSTKKLERLILPDEIISSTMKGK